MNIKKVQELVDLMEKSDLIEIDIEHEGVKIKIVRKAHGVIEHQVIPQASIQQAQQAGAQHGQIPEPAKQDKAKVIEIKSPMVGTFYRSTSPETDPYVKKGDTIHKGDVLCIIEAMKLMNEVKSDVEGKINDILVENAEPVEFGQVIFLIEPL